MDAESGVRAGGGRGVLLGRRGSLVIEGVGWGGGGGLVGAMWGVGGLWWEDRWGFLKEKMVVEDLIAEK